MSVTVGVGFRVGALSARSQGSRCRQNVASALLSFQDCSRSRRFPWPSVYTPRLGLVVMQEKVQHMSQDMQEVVGGLEEVQNTTSGVGQGTGSALNWEVFEVHVRLCSECSTILTISL